MKNLQNTSKLLAVALLLSVASQVVAVPGMDTAKRLGKNVAGFFKPYPNRKSHRYARECEFDVYSQEAKDNAAKPDASRWTKAKAKLYWKSAYCFTTNHPYLASAGKYTAIATVVSGLGYGAYQLYQKYAGKKAEGQKLNVLKNAAQVIVHARENGVEEVATLTEIFTAKEVAALVSELDKTQATVLAEAVAEFDSAKNAEELKKAQEQLNAAVDACDKALAKAAEKAAEKEAEEETAEQA